MISQNNALFFIIVLIYVYIHNGDTIAKTTRSEDNNPLWMCRAALYVSHREKFMRDINKFNPLNFSFLSQDTPNLYISAKI
jgi:hypothetical protein